MDDVPQEAVPQELPAEDFVEEVPELIVLEAASCLVVVNILQTFASPYSTNQSKKKLRLMRIMLPQKQYNAATS